MKRRVLIFLFAFTLLNSTVAYAEENTYEEGLEVNQLQENVENLDEGTGGIEGAEDIPEESVLEEPKEIEVKAKTHRGWYFDEEVRKWFYYDQKGTMKYGWLKEKGKWYYLDKNDSSYPGAMSANCKNQNQQCDIFFR